MGHIDMLISWLKFANHLLRLILFKWFASRCDILHAEINLSNAASGGKVAIFLFITPQA